MASKKVTLKDPHRALRHFMWQHCITNGELAEITGLKQKQAWNIKMGHSVISLKAALVIDSLTDGEIPLSAWVQDVNHEALYGLKQREYTEGQRRKIRKAKNIKRI